MKRNAQLALQRGALLKLNYLAAINAALDTTFDPSFREVDRHGVITEVNADLLTEGTTREALTTYAVGYNQGTFDADLEFLAPSVPVGRRFSYKTHNNTEAFFASLTDDLRPIGGDFKQVEYTKEEVEAKTSNRGLQIRVDADQVADVPNWEEHYTGMLMRRLQLNKLRRAIAALSAAAVNTGKTWDTTAGKDPDQDVNSELIAGADASGVNSNRIAYSPTAWAKRILAHRAQNTAGGFASAGMSAAELAAFLNVEGVLRCDARYATSSSAKAQALGALVLMFNAMSNPTVEDSSNIKAFYSMCSNGQKVQVHRWDVGAKAYYIAVEHYEKIAITSTLGIRQLTIS